MLQETEKYPALPKPASDDLLQAMKNLVRSKYLLDKAVREEGGASLAGELAGDQTGPMLGSCFYRAVFPFVPLWKSNARFSAMVPRNQTIGSSYWRNKDLKPEKRKKLLQFFINLDKGSLTEEVSNKADYQWIRPLGLVIPHEGKNRVDFLLEMGVDMIPARVTEHDYPSADRLILYMVKVYAKCEWWAVLDSRWLQRVNHPSWALPVLSAYGVTIREKWPLEFPTEEEVISGFSHPSGNLEFLDKAILDLENIAAIKARQQEIVFCSFMSIPSIELRSKAYIWYLFAGLFASLIGMTLLPKTFIEQLGIFVGTVFGTTLGVMFIFTCPMFRGKKVDVEKRI